jgi:integrase
MLLQVDEEAKEIEARYGLEASRQFRAVAKGNEAFVKDTYSEWLAQCTDAPQTKVQHAATVKRFIEWSGELATINLPRKKAGEYINALLSGSTGPTIKRGTIERHASSLSSLWRWYISRGMADENPWKGHQLSSKKLKRQAARTGLSDDSLLKLLSTVYGTGNYRQLHPDLLRLGLLTGARIEALCALKCENVERREDGYWFHIENDKSEAGTRVIPIHSAADSIIERRLKDKNTYLFKGLIPGGIQKKRSHAVSKAYLRFRTAAGVAGSGEVFHALRNTFTEMMEGHGVPESTVKLYIGHERDSMTYGHYSKGTKVELRATINRLDYGAEIMEAIRRNPCGD